MWAASVIHRQHVSLQLQNVLSSSLFYQKLERTQLSERLVQFQMRQMPMQSLSWVKYGNSCCPSSQNGLYNCFANYNRNNCCFNLCCDSKPQNRYSRSIGSVPRYRMCILQFDFHYYQFSSSQIIHCPKCEIQEIRSNPLSFRRSWKRGLKRWRNWMLNGQCPSLILYFCRCFSFPSLS